ncbi:MAG: RsmB/NOP family class I SAM-dependent RNA methyltransferase [Muribaculaceae bacterium]|nr:RsmB/NOP family class I SAM-dependent RNA methyltransferase [Muribaculaceae bacterium]
MEISSRFKAIVDELKAAQPRVNGLLESLENSTPSVSIRLNKSKIEPEAFIKQTELLKRSNTVKRVPWCDRGYILKTRPSFTFDPSLHQGLYYVQDASSMFISHVIKSLNLEKEVAYLDACAAPGGKTTAAIDTLPEGSLVVANEWDYRRAEILKENVIKWGYPAVVVSRGDTAKFGKLRDTFDIIAADVPCSGEGMMRKDQDAVKQWSPALVEECADRQKEIIKNLWPALKPGGYMIYSTCTFNRKENEEILDYIAENFDAEIIQVPMIEEFKGIVPGISTEFHCYRFMPHLVEGEGLFMALIRKPGNHSPRSEKIKTQKQQHLPIQIPSWFPEGMKPRLSDGTLYAIPAQWDSLINKLTSNLDTILTGVEVATIKGKDIIPSQSLAMSTVLDRSKFPNVELEKTTALKYLHRDAIELPDDTPRGYVLVTCNNVPLGWVKNIGNRSNNLYPTAWRIIKQIPE